MTIISLSLSVTWRKFMVYRQKQLEMTTHSQKIPKIKEKLISLENSKCSVVLERGHK